ncbi:hypothetical protein COLO4_28659 [Corchorus olitorius]|uniref:Uncharacterized protein n=1 Tax=Corchorus olitorius TaxID=93759 RepID=A0A1R3HIZ8_9ROSI|nr:hypothetical protein COLO4_28659 [Corchorus olitorius]
MTFISRILKEREAVCVHPIEGAFATENGIRMSWLRF